MIIDEKIIAGKHGLAGEIGHIHVRDEETEHCNCGGVGCLEQVASATGIAREARRKMKATDTPSALRKFGDDVTAKMFSMRQRMEMIWRLRLWRRLDVILDLFWHSWQ